MSCPRLARATAVALPMPESDPVMIAAMSRRYPGVARAMRIKRGTEESNLEQRFWRPLCCRYTSPPGEPLRIVRCLRGGRDARVCRAVRGLALRRPQRRHPFLELVDPRVDALDRLKRSRRRVQRGAGLRGDLEHP